MNFSKMLNLGYFWLSANRAAAIGADDADARVVAAQSPIGIERGCLFLRRGRVGIAIRRRAALGPVFGRGLGFLSGGRDGAADRTLPVVSDDANAAAIGTQLPVWGKGGFLVILCWHGSS
jgi:hypothetical protein